MDEYQKVRVDKWLWSVRLFKTRTVSTSACKSGKVKLNDKTLKASFLLKGDELLHVKKNGFDLEIKVGKLINKRVGAPIAVTCYENLTSEEEMKKFEAWFVGKAKPEMRERGAGRPTKRDRRDIDRFKGDIFEMDDD